MRRKLEKKRFKMLNNPTTQVNTIGRDQELEVIGKLGFVWGLMNKSHNENVAVAHGGREPLYVIESSETETIIGVNPKHSHASKTFGLKSHLLCQISLAPSSMETGRIQINMPKIKGIDEPIQIVVQQDGTVQLLGKDVSEDLQRYATLVAEKGLPSVRNIAANALAP